MGNVRQQLLGTALNNLVPETFQRDTTRKKFTKGYNSYLTRCLTRFAIQAKGPDGKWTRKPLVYRESISVRLRVTRPPEIYVNLGFKHIDAGCSNTIRKQFVPSIYSPM